MRVVFDVETTIKNKGNPYTKSNQLVAYSILKDKDQSTHYYDELEFLKPIRNLCNEKDTLVGFNIKFDLHWALRSGFTLPDRVNVWDCQIAQFIIEGQKNRYPSLDSCLEYFKLPKKLDKITEYWKLGVDTTDIPKEELLPYVKHDVLSTSVLQEKQYEVMNHSQRQLCWVMGMDLLVLLEMEQAGLKLDQEKCNEKLEACLQKVTKITHRLHEVFGNTFCNFDSNHHLSAILFGGAIEVDFPEYEKCIYKSGLKKGQEYLKAKHSWKVFHFPGIFKPDEKNLSKLVIKIGGLPEYPVYFTSEDVLKQLPKRTKEQKEVVELLLERAEQSKLINTYYSALPILIDTMEWQDDYIHGSFNQCVAATGRLSSSKPNLQNFSSAVDEVIVSRYD